MHADIIQEKSNTHKVI